MHLTLAISYTCLSETSPTMSDPGAPEPLSIFAAFFSRYDTGGVLNVKLNVRSGLIVMSVGIGTSGLKCAVRALLRLAQTQARRCKEG